MCTLKRIFGFSSFSFNANMARHTALSTSTRTIINCSTSYYGCGVIIHVQCAVCSVHRLHWPVQCAQCNRKSEERKSVCASVQCGKWRYLMKTKAFHSCCCAMCMYHSMEKWDWALMSVATLCFSKWKLKTEEKNSHSFVVKVFFNICHSSVVVDV